MYRCVHAGLCWTVVLTAIPFFAAGDDKEPEVGWSHMPWAEILHVTM